MDQGAMRAHIFLFGIALAACAPERAPRGPATIPVSEHSVITQDSVRLSDRVGGAGPTTVSAPFAMLLESSLDSLAREHRVVTYDPRGRGRSDSVDPSKVSLAHLLLDFETVRKAVGAEQVA